MLRPALLRLVEAAEAPAAIATALAGGSACAPLPVDRVERAAVVKMLAPERPLVEADAAAVVATSGSTGAPKGVVLSSSAVRAAADATHARLGGPGDWVLALPVHYVAGLMVLARAAVAGRRAVVARSDLADLPDRVAELDGPRYLSLVPTQLARALAQPALAAALARCDTVLVGGAAAAPALLARAATAGIACVTTYGMSETCGGCVYDGAPLAGAEITIEEEGRVVIGGAQVFSGYRLRPALTATALVGGRFRTEDRGEWRDGRLRVLGRLDDVVVSGGLNVDLTEVERHVQAWSAARGADAAVVAVPDAEWGARVAAALDRDLPLTELRHDLAAELPAYALPRQLAYVSPLPRLASGKLDRQRLRALVSQQVGS